MSTIWNGIYDLESLSDNPTALRSTLIDLIKKSEELQVYVPFSDPSSGECRLVLYVAGATVGGRNERTRSRSAPA